MLNNYLLKISQYLTWPIFFVYFNLFYKLDIRGQKNLSCLVSPFIIVANHVSFLDSFLFRIVLGISTTHLPLRFMAVRHFKWKSLNFLADMGVIDFIYNLFGVFVVTPGLGLHKNLETARNIIYSGGNVVIYPEGEVSFDDYIRPFKSGAATLALETGAKILLVSFRIKKTLTFRPNLVVTIGEPMTPSMYSIEADLTKQFFDSITNMYFSS